MTFYTSHLFSKCRQKKHKKALHFLAHISAILCLVLFVLCLYCANCGLWAQLPCGRQSRPFPGFLLIIPNSNFCISNSPFFSSSLRNKAILYSKLKDKRQGLMQIRLRNSAFIFSIIHLITVRMIRLVRVVRVVRMARLVYWLYGLVWSGLWDIMDVHGRTEGH